MLMCVRAHVCVLGLRGRMAFLVVVHAAFLNALVCVCVCVCVYACVYVCVCMRVLGLRGRVAFLVVVHAASPYVLVCVCVCVCVSVVCACTRVLGLWLHGLSWLWCSSFSLRWRVSGSTGFTAPWHVGSSRPGIQTMSPVWRGGFLPTVPPRKPPVCILKLPLTLLIRNCWLVTVVFLGLSLLRAYFLRLNHLLPDGVDLGNS